MLDTEYLKMQHLVYLRHLFKKNLKLLNRFSMLKDHRFVVLKLFKYQIFATSS